MSLSCSLFHGCVAASQAEFELTPVLGVCVGIVCGLLVVALGIVLALKFRTDNRRTPPLKATKTEYRVEVNDEDKNPDIIPSSKGKTRLVCDLE